MHTLDWKHAWTGRLLTTAPTRPQALKLLEPQLDSCNARLIGEVASGKLPFLTLPFRSSLTARLKALTPQLRRSKRPFSLSRISRTTKGRGCGFWTT